MVLPRFKLRTILTILFLIPVLVIAQPKQTKEFPGSFQMMKWYWTGFPKTYGGWKIDFRETFRMTGYTEGYIFSEVNLRCDTCGLLSKYTYNIYLKYGMGDEDQLSVSLNKDTTDKYFKLKH